MHPNCQAWFYHQSLHNGQVVGAVTLKGIDLLHCSTAVNM